MRASLEKLVASVVPGARLRSVRRFGVDTPHEDNTTKAVGYGKPLRLDVETSDGSTRALVFHMATPNAFGHDRRADRAADMLLAHDTFGLIPNHVQVLDVGAVTDDGRLLSLQHGGELYVLTTFAPGHIYADELRSIEKAQQHSELDMRHCRQLARYLAELHASPVEPNPTAYTRAIRDLVGDGEGIFGLVDGYPDDCPGAPLERLQALEARCVSQRWKWKGKHARLARTHGDFHPFNIVFDDASSLSLLDASRGCLGDPADDLTCLAINYVFFALGAPGSWSRGFGPLWRELFRVYFEHRSDDDLLSAAPAFFAWRALVVCNPSWYPHIERGVREAILGFAERALDEGRLEPAAAEDLFA
jgi:hypothetical protein